MNDHAECSGSAAAADDLIDALFRLDNYWHNDREVTDLIAAAVLPLLGHRCGDNSVQP